MEIGYSLNSVLDIQKNIEISRIICIIHPKSLIFTFARFLEQRITVSCEQFRGFTRGFRFPRQKIGVIQALISNPLRYPVLVIRARLTILHTNLLSIIFLRNLSNIHSRNSGLFY